MSEANTNINTIYVGNQVNKDTLVSRVDQDVVSWLIDKNKNASENQFVIIAPANYNPNNKNHAAEVNKQIKAIKDQNTAFFLASAFGTLDEPRRPDQSPRKISKNGGILRRYIALDYDLTTIEEANQLRENAIEFFTKLHNYKFILYPSISFPFKPHVRIVVNIDETLDKKTYKPVAEALIRRLGLETNDYVANTSITHNFNAPMYLSGSKADQFVVINENGTNMPIDALDVKEPTTNKRLTKKEKSENLRKNAGYNDTQLQQVVDAFVEDPKTKEKLSDYDYFWKFAESLANAKLNDLVSQEFVDDLLIKIAYGNPEWETKNPEVYQAQLSKLEANPDKRNLVRPLNSYLPITAQVQQANPHINNLPQLLLKLLPSNFEGSTEIEVKDAADIIGQFFEFALLPNIDSNADALAIFNPLSGLWVHDENNLISLLTIVKPTITPLQFKTALMYWAAQANQNNRFIDPYSGSQYIVFLNGVLDITTMTLHPLSSDLVKNLYFTNRHQLNIEYNPDAQLKVFKRDGLEGADWDIKNFLMAYADNNKTIYKYFLFGLSLGLFAGHNSGIHFDISGPSGFGKSTLANIFRGLYGPRRIANIKFSDFNKDFPLNNYDFATTIIWVSEANANTTGLDEDNGTPFYDSLADSSARLPVKHQGDVIVDDPPQVYVDGTQLVQSTDLNSGPARRTMPFVLPMDADKLRPQFYSNNIADRLKDPENLQYLVNQMIAAFKETVPEARQTNFKMNLGLPEDIALLPERAQRWREDALLGSDDITEWFEDNVKPALIMNDESAWIHDRIFYELYQYWYSSENPNDPSGRYAKRQPRLINELHTLFQKQGIYCIKAVETGGRTRRSISGPDAMAINWKIYNETSNRPASLADKNGIPNFFGKKKTDVYRLVTIKPSPKFHTLGVDGMYTPITLPNN